MAANLGFSPAVSGIVPSDSSFPPTVTGVVPAGSWFPPPTQLYVQKNQCCSHLNRLKSALQD